MTIVEFAKKWMPDNCGHSEDVEFLDNLYFMVEQLHEQQINELKDLTKKVYDGTYKH
jgi:hypothetical protein